MMSWTLGELARAAEAELARGDPSTNIAGVSTDSRSLPSGSLFVALRGERFDGHAFVDSAIQKGAKAVLVERAHIGETEHVAVPRLLVSDTLRALGQIASIARTRLGHKVVGITGSNGKTTTKELTAAALGALGAVYRTQGNMNNLIGVPLTLLRWPAEAGLAVLEMGMSVPGEMARLTRIAKPDVGVITNVAQAHLQGLGDVTAVARAKGELFANLHMGAVAVVNDDDPWIKKVCADVLAGRPQVSFGTRNGCDVRLLGCDPNPPGVLVMLEVHGELLACKLPLVGRHNGLNAAAALAVALALDIDARAAARSMETVSPPASRLQVIKTKRWHLLDDTYNANPGSMQAAFSALADLAGSNRRVAVLGDMFELGETAPALHEEVGRAAASSGIDWIVGMGELAPHTVAGAASQGARAAAFGTLDGLLAALEAGLRPGDWVLVKGSRAMRMERVVGVLCGDALCGGIVCEEGVL